MTITCIDCKNGGHNGHTLYSIWTNIATGEKGYACAQHVANHISVKEVRRG